MENGSQRAKALLQHWWRWCNDGSQHFIFTRCPRNESSLHSQRQQLSCICHELLLHKSVGQTFKGVVGNPPTFVKSTFVLTKNILLVALCLSWLKISYHMYHVSFDSRSRKL
ncbi:hypothetical protein ACH5RR_040133 [Cinchona calisaya]|uniref:Uncharacterized protein n=1 Tax=Cinchona calisaya TaxID=153742 RepID=A0ABD2XSH5_9GENT